MTPRYPTTDIAQNLPKLPTHPWCQAIASISQFFLLGVLPPPQDLCVFTQVLQLQVSVLFFFSRQLYLTPPKTSADLDSKHITLLQLQLVFSVLMVSLYKTPGSARAVLWLTWTMVSNIEQSPRPAVGTECCSGTEFSSGGMSWSTWAVTTNILGNL